MDVTEILPVLGALVALTNVTVQVLKRVTWDKVPTNLVAVLVALVLTVLAGLAYCQIRAVAVTWYLVASFIVGGFMVSYAAMFGYDKLKAAMGWRQ